MNKILEYIDIKTTEYFIIKEKIGHTYHNLLKYKNNIFNRVFLTFKNFDSSKELYIVPEFNGVEGVYYKI